MNRGHLGGQAPPPAPGSRLGPVSLPDLRRDPAPRRWPVDQPIAGLESLTPVRGWVQVALHDRLLEVEGTVETIVTLRCDRCLQHFNHPLRARAKELLELAEAEGRSPVGNGLGERAGERMPEERVDPNGSFDPERWVFEQLSLEAPLVNRCGPDCGGPACWSSDTPGGPAGHMGHAGHDPRWAELARLRGE